MSEDVEFFLVIYINLFIIILNNNNNKEEKMKWWKKGSRVTNSNIKRLKEIVRQKRNQRKFICNSLAKQQQDGLNRFKKHYMRISISLSYTLKKNQARNQASSNLWLMTQIGGGGLISISFKVQRNWTHIIFSAITKNENLKFSIKKKKQHATIFIFKTETLKKKKKKHFPLTPKFCPNFS